MTDEAILIEQLKNVQTKERAYVELVSLYKERLYWHIRKIVIRENKWWYRCIRSMNWFSFRYWWFNWLVFLGCIFLFWCFCPCMLQEVDENCSSSIDQHMSSVKNLGN